MTSDKTVKLAFVLQTTDSMSAVLEKVSKNSLPGFKRTVAKIGKEALSIGGHMQVMGEGVLGFVMNIAKSTSAYGADATKTSQKVGMAVEEWQKLAYAAEFAGVGNEQLATGMAKFDKVLVETAKGTGTAAQTVEELGIAVKDNAGNSEPAN